MTPIIRAAELPGTADHLLAEHGWTWCQGLGWIYNGRISHNVVRLANHHDGRPAGWAPSINDDGNCALAYEAMGRIEPW